MCAYNIFFDSYNLTSNNATILSSLNVAGNLIGSGTALSNLNSSSIINPPNLSVYATNANFNSLSNYSDLILILQILI